MPPTAFNQTEVVQDGIMHVCPVMCGDRARKSARLSGSTQGERALKRAARNRLPYAVCLAVRCCRYRGSDRWSGDAVPFVSHSRLASE
jgi:hypothetical protein